MWTHMNDDTQNELTGKAAYEAKKAEKKAQQQSAGGGPNTSALKTWAVWIGVAVLIIGGISWWIWSQLPKSEDLSRAVPIENRQHVNEGTTVETYATNPPAGGPHYPRTAAVGFYGPGEAPADEYIVHNLEHGDVWITYHPRVGDAVADTLRDFVDAKVLVSAREANETDIALSAWGRIDTFDLSDGVVPQERIRDFIARYKNKGPERITTPAPPGATVGNPQ